MSGAGKCQDCGAATLVINRTIGFFGLNEVYSKWCLECVGNHARKVGYTPDRAANMIVALAEEEAQRHAKAKNKSFSGPRTGHLLMTGQKNDKRKMPSQFLLERLADNGDKRDRPRLCGMPEDTLRNDF